MSIQGNINQGINMAALLYRMSPAYEKKQIKTRAFEQMAGAQKAEKEVVQGEGKRDKHALQRTQNEQLKNIKGATEDFDREQYRQVIQRQHEQAERIAEKYRNARESLLGMKLTGEEEKQLKELGELMSKDYNEYLTESQRWSKEVGKLDEEWAQRQIQTEENEAEMAQGIVHESGAPQSSASAPQSESSESAPEPAPELDPSEKAMRSLIRAQNRQNLKQQRMDAARANLRQDWKDRKITRDQFRQALVENGYIGGKE